MKEDFLHYLWKFKKFDSTNLTTFNGESITIINTGEYLQLAGPDFFNARIIIGKQKWAGNIEIHVRSSDWYLHHHESDPAYDNVILHVVWEHDAEIFRKDNTELTVLELRHHVSQETLESYKTLTTPKSWIFCEKQLASVDAFVLKNWLERLFFERLERKSVAIMQMLSDGGNDWEGVLFCVLAKNFGLNSNGDIFMSIAQSIPFGVIRKAAVEAENLEALLLGRAGLLDTAKEDIYFKYLKSSFDFLSHKYQLKEVHIDPVQFFKHRPDNFPTIRLAQLAQLYHVRQNLFSQLIHLHAKESLYDVLRIDVSGYWQSHYQFDRQSTERRKPLSTAFIDLLLVNSVIPVQFAYAKSLGKDLSEELVSMAVALPTEKNAVIDKFGSFGIRSKSAFDSQSLLQLKNEYCNKGKCLECAIGVELLKPEIEKRL